MPEDSPMASVREALACARVPLVFLDQREIAEWEVTLELDPAVSGSVRTRTQHLSLDVMTGAYLRPYDSRRLPVVRQAGAASALWQHALTLEDALWTWADMTSALV